MPTWRCPHCGAPQPESARCWVCRRSTTCCSTCRHFRRGVAAQLGYCGLDRRRAPLTGDEIRGCWQAAPTPRNGDRGLRTHGRAASRGSRRQPVDFVPVASPDPANHPPEARRPPGLGGAMEPGGPERPPGGESAVLRFILWEDAEA